jgi:hypothetical protein
MARDYMSAAKYEKKRKSTDEYMDEVLKKEKEKKKDKKKSKRTSAIEKRLKDSGLTDEEVKRLRGK